MAPVNGEVDVAEHLDGRRALSVASGDVPRFQSKCVAFVLVGGFIALAGRRRRTHRGHQPPRVVVRGIVDDPVGGALLLDVARV